MIHREIKVVADSLEDAHRLAKGQLPAGLLVISETVVREGLESRTVKAAAESSAAAMAKAQAGVPNDVTVLSQREIVAPAKKTIVIEAIDESTARLEA